MWRLVVLVVVVFPTFGSNDLDRYDTCLTFVGYGYGWVIEEEVIYS